MRRGPNLDHVDNFSNDIDHCAADDIDDDVLKRNRGPGEPGAQVSAL